MISILFLDEEHALRSVCSEVLRNEGYTVLEAADLAQAAQACKEYSGPIDVAIVNAQDGAVAEATWLAGKYPHVRVLFIGGPEWKPRVRRSRATKSAWLQKPFTSEALLTAIRGLTKHAVMHTGQ